MWRLWSKPRVITLTKYIHINNRVYFFLHGFGQAKFAYGGYILGSSQLTQLHQQPLKQCRI